MLCMHTAHTVYSNNHSSFQVYSLDKITTLTILYIFIYIYIYMIVYTHLIGNFATKVNITGLISFSLTQNFTDSLTFDLMIEK